MTRAFHGDPALKAELLERLHLHAAAGTLVFGATRWDGRSGSPIGVSVRSEQSADYAERFGYPLALAGLLDTMASCAAPDQQVQATLTWVEAVEPGADLSCVPWRIAEDLLLRVGADRFAPEYFPLLHDLHRHDSTDAPVLRRTWADLRDLIEMAAADSTGEVAVAMNACAAACWSLRTSRSLLVELVDRWRRAAWGLPNPDFTEADRDHADAVLRTLWTQTQAARDAGETVHIPTLFRVREPRLSALFEADLARSNASFQQRSEAIPALVLRHLAAAGRDDILS